MPNIISIFKSDSKLLESIKCGDDSVLGYLYEKNLRMITKYIKENNGSDYEASEILQDALVILWEKIHETEFVLTSKISTYIYSIVKRKWMQELARKKRYTVLDDVKKNPGSDKNAEENLQDYITRLEDEGFAVEEGRLADFNVDWVVPIHFLGDFRSYAKQKGISHIYLDKEICALFFLHSIDNEVEANVFYYR